MMRCNMAEPTHIRSTPRAADMANLSPQDVRSTFLIENIFNKDRVALTFTDLDRMAVGGVSPAGEAVELTPDRETGTEFFLQRREMGVINVGGAGTITTDGTKHDLANLDCLYIGMGTKSVTFASADQANPAKFYIISCPAHHTFPTTKVTKSEANPRALGAQATANQRKIFQYIHQGGIKSCQLVMGFTELAEGSVWNTMPPHTHTRRTEIYFYFDTRDNIVMHFLGEPQATHHLVCREGDVALSPNWSIHCGCGTGAYKFIWAMAG